MEVTDRNGGKWTFYLDSQGKFRWTLEQDGKLAAVSAEGHETMAGCVEHAKNCGLEEGPRCFGKTAMPYPSG